MECVYCVVIVLICLNVLLIFVMGSFSLVSRLFVDMMCDWGYIPSSYYDVIVERLVFCSFLLKHLHGKSIITTCKLGFSSGGDCMGGLRHKVSRV